MKGHVGGGPGSGSSRCRVLGKAKPFHRSSLQGFGFGSGSYMSFTFPYVIYVQERLLEMSVFVLGLFLLAWMRTSNLRV